MYQRRIFSFILVVAIALGVAAVGAGKGLSAEAQPAAAAPAVAEAEGGLTQSSWWDAAQASILEAEYALTRGETSDQRAGGTVYQAPNRANNLRTYFTPEGIRVAARDQADPAWEFGLALSRWGMGDALAPVEKAELSASGSRIEYRRGALVEWYVNDERGLEQGFTLMRRPSRENGDLIVLEMALSGSLRARQAGDQAVDLLNAAGGQILRYGELKTTDAVGRELASALRLAEGGDRLWIEVEAGGAAFPVTIDPIVKSPNWPVEGNQAGAQLGFSLGSAGDVNGDGYDDVVVGAKFFDSGGTDRGAAFLFQGSNIGLANTAAQTFLGSQANAWMGAAVGAAGDVNGDGFADVIVGAPGANRATVYLGSASGVDSTADWTGSGSGAYGSAVGTAGYVNDDGYADVIVGAPGANSATVYFGAASGMDTTADWTGSGGAGSLFGAAAGTAGDVDGNGFSDVIVGAPGANSATVYLSTASGMDTTADWSGSGSGKYGAAAGGAGDVNGDGYADVIVGAPEYSAGQANEGVGFIYFGSSSGVANTAGVTVEGEQAGANLGAAVAGAGDVNGDGFADFLMGAPHYDLWGIVNNVNTLLVDDEGAAFLYFGANSGMVVTPTARLDSNQTGALMGAAVGTAGDVNADGYADMLIGAPQYDGGQTNEGAAFAYLGGPYRAERPTHWSYASGQTDAQLGISVSTAGDVNGDGFDDIIVGAWRYSNPLSSEGAAFVWYGSPTGPKKSGYDWMAEGNLESVNLGSSVASAGDVNGDGYDDVVIGAMNYNSAIDGGKIFIWYGSSTGLGVSGTPLNADWSASIGNQSAWLGYTVGTAGDVNGDGYSDVLAAAPRYSNGEVNEGGVFVWYGGPNGPTSYFNWKAESNLAYASPTISQGDFPTRLAGTAGDVNGDGYDDIVAGFSMYSHGQNGEGMVFAWYGSATGLGPEGSPLNADWQAEGNHTAGWFGSSTGTAGDVNGDGYDDVIIGEMGYFEGGDIDYGAAYVWHGASGGLPGGTPANPAGSAEANWKKSPSSYRYSNYGTSAGTAGDINGDGYDEVIIGGPNYIYFPPEHPGGINVGVADLFNGSAEGLSNTLFGGWSDTGHNLLFTGDEWYGYSASTAGDVNGDGFSDLIVSEINYSYNLPTNIYHQGRVNLYYGNLGAGKPVLAQQRRVVGSALIHDGGQAISTNAVQLTATGRAPFGPAQVKAQWEVKPEGMPLDGSVLVESGWQNSGADGAATFTQDIEGLNFEQRYHWRVRILARPLKAPATSPVTHRSRWINGDSFFTALSGTQAITEPITQTQTTKLLGQRAYVQIASGQRGGLTSLELRGYPDTAHPKENFYGGGSNMVDRYFTITPNSGAAGYTLTLCLNYDDSELALPSGGTLTEGSFRLCRWDGSAWTCPARAAGSDPSTNLVCAAGVTELSDWTLGYVGPTDIELIDLQARSGPATPLGTWALLAGLALAGVLGLAAVKARNQERR